LQIVEFTARLEGHHAAKKRKPDDTSFFLYTMIIGGPNR
jgi:hypothetical protein